MREDPSPPLSLPLLPSSSPQPFAAHPSPQVLSAGGTGTAMADHSITCWVPARPEGPHSPPDTAAAAAGAAGEAALAAAPESGWQQLQRLHQPSEPSGREPDASFLSPGAAGATGEVRGGEAEVPPECCALGTAPCCKRSRADEPAAAEP